MKFATTARPIQLPAAPNVGQQLYSVPLPNGGFDYYAAPPGSAVPLNDDYPVPNVAHPNDIGLSSLHVGRPMPPGCRKVGSGDIARGSVTAAPWAGGKLKSIDDALGIKAGASGMSGFGAVDDVLGEDGLVKANLAVVGVLLGIVGTWAWKKR